MTTRHGALFPSVPAMVARDGDSYLLVGPTGMRSKIRGEICSEITESLARGEATARLRALMPAHNMLGQLSRWLATPSVPLTREDAVRLDGFDVLFVELTGQCNERCVHCYADAAPTVTDALPREVVLRIVDEARTLGFSRIQFTGGDPLLCGFLPEAVAHARTLEFPFIEIYTNGLALTDDLLDALAPSRPAFAFSFYSTRPEVHDGVTRTPGSHRRTLAAIDRAVARGLQVRAAAIVTTEDEDVDALVTFLRARGVGWVSWSRTSSVGRGTEIAEQSRQRDVVAPAQREGGGHGGSNDGSSRRRGKLCVTYTGEVVPCIFQRGSTLGNVRAGSSLANIIAGDGRVRPPKPPRSLPLATEVRARLTCPSCQLTDVALDWLEGSR